MEPKRPTLGRCHRRWGVLLALLLLPPLRLALAQETPAVPTPEAPATPLAIPLAEIAQRAEETDRTLRKLAEGLTPKASVRKVRDGIPDASERADRLAAETKTALRGSPAPSLLDHLTSRWQGLKTELTVWADGLQKRVAALEADVTTLTGLGDVWRASRKLAKVSAAPETVVERMQRTLTDIDALRAEMAQLRAEALVLQDSVTRIRGRCTESIDRIAKFRRTSLAQLFTPDSPPIWSKKSAFYLWGQKVPLMWSALVDDARWLYNYLIEKASLVALHVVLGLGFLSLILRARRRLRLGVEQDGQLAEGMVVLERPFSAAFVLFAFLSLWIYPEPPRILNEVAATLALLPMLRLLLGLVDRPLRPALYLLAAFFVLDRLRGLAAVEPRLEETLVLVEFAAAIVLVAWLLRARLRPSVVANGSSGSARIAYAGGRILLVFFGLSFLAGALGYMRLARLLGTGFLRSSYFALALFAAYRVALGLVAYALQTRVLRALGMVRRHRLLIERRVGAALRLAVMAFWVVYLLHTTDLWEPTKETVEAIVTADLRIGEISVSLGDLIAFGLAVWLSFVLSAFVRFALEEDVYPRLRMARGVPYAVSTLLHYSILLVGFFLAFAAMGLDLNRFTILAGAFGVGIGFGMQNIVNNFVSGLILLFERPVQVGDTVQLGEIFGEVRRIGIRSSTVRTPEGAEVIVPNASLIADPVTNWTLSDRMRRVDVPVGVAYGSNPERVQEILRTVATQHPLVRRDPAPVALFKALGESSLDFELRAWTNNFEDWVAIRSQLILGIHEALGQAGIAIPFPQRDLHVRTLPPLGPLAGKSE